MPGWPTMHTFIGRCGKWPSAWLPSRRRLWTYGSVKRQRPHCGGRSSIRWMIFSSTRCSGLASSTGWQNIETCFRSKYSSPCSLAGHNFRPWLRVSIIGNDGPLIRLLQCLRAGLQREELGDNLYLIMSLTAFMIASLGSSFGLMDGMFIVNFLMVEMMRSTTSMSV